LKDEDPALFSIYSTWLTTGDVEDSEDLIGPGDLESLQVDKEKMGEQFRQLSQCYVLGDFLQDRKFCNSLLDTMVARSKRGLEGDINVVIGSSPEVIDIIFTKRSSGSPLRRLLLDNILAKVTPTPLKRGLRPIFNLVFRSSTTNYLYLP
jgi:hypothetical protein